MYGPNLRSEEGREAENKETDFDAMEAPAHPYSPPRPHSCVGKGRALEISTRNKLLEGLTEALFRVDVKIVGSLVNSRPHAQSALFLLLQS